GSEVEAHDDAALGRGVHLGEAGVIEDAALADVQFTPRDVRTGVDDHRVALDRTRPAVASEAHRRLGQGAAHPTAPETDTHRETGDGPDAWVRLVLVAALPRDLEHATQSVVHRPGLDPAPTDRLVFEIGDEAGGRSRARLSAVGLLSKPLA